jgi:hypothetical protein
VVSVRAIAGYGAEVGGMQDMPDEKDQLFRSDIETGSMGRKGMSCDGRIRGEVDAESTR